MIKIFSVRKKTNYKFLAGVYAVLIGYSSYAFSSVWTSPVLFDSALDNKSNENLPSSEKAINFEAKIFQEISVSKLVSEVYSVPENIEIIEHEVGSGKLESLFSENTLSSLLSSQSAVFASSDNMKPIKNIGINNSSDFFNFDTTAIFSIEDASLQEQYELIADALPNKDQEDALSQKIEGAIAKGNNTQEDTNLSMLDISKIDTKLPKPAKVAANISVGMSVKSPRNRVSIATSREQVLKTLIKLKHQDSKVVLEQQYGSTLSELSLQFIDDRSNLETRDIFPAGNLNAVLIGSELVLSSDAMGYVHLGDLPVESDFIVVTGDDNGIYKKMIHEVSTTDKPDSGVMRLKTIRSFSFNMWAQMAGVVENTEFSQICGQIYVKDSAGYQISFNAESEGVYYFNELGYLDRRLDQTSSNGKYCIFNTDNGQALVTATSLNSGKSISQLVHTQASYLSWTELYDESVDFVVRYGVAGSGYEQLSSDEAVKNSVKMIDYAALELVESQSKGEYLSAGSLVFKNAARDPNGYAHVMVDAFELEPSIVRVPSSFLQGDYVIPFYPRGFIEDVAIINNDTFDSSLGQVAIEHGLLNDEDANSLSIKLYNDLGSVTGEARYIDNSPVLKAVFYNVPEGRYLVVLKDGDGRWISSKLVHVTNSRVSIVRSGRQHIINQSYCDVECLSR